MTLQESAKLPAKKERAITALLSEPTLREAAARCGVNETTLWRWTQEDDFRRAYRETRRHLVEKAVGELQAACTEAVTALRRNLTCGHASAEIAAAKAIIEQAAKGLELADLAERVESLEALLAGQKGVANGPQRAAA
jgi:DNA-binding MurR/RpiR family transcriptional regulator